MTKNIRVFRSKGCPEMDKRTLALFVRYLNFSIHELGLDNIPVKIRLLGKAPNEPITTGAYDPSNKTISVVCGGRHFIDFCRTIAHELTHMKQDYNNELRIPHQEIGGHIEDEANALAGRITKYYIKKLLSKEEKAHLGLGTYGN